MRTKIFLLQTVGGSFRSSRQWFIVCLNVTNGIGIIYQQSYGWIFKIKNVNLKTIASITFIKLANVSGTFWG